MKPSLNWYLTVCTAAVAASVTMALALNLYGTLDQTLLDAAAYLTMPVSALLWTAAIVMRHVQDRRQSWHPNPGRRELDFRRGINIAFLHAAFISYGLILLTAGAAVRETGENTDIATALTLTGICTIALLPAGGLAMTWFAWRLATAKRVRRTPA